MIDISKYKLIYNNKVWKPLAIISFIPKPPFDSPDATGPIIEMDHLDVMALDEDGAVIIISDEAWKFQGIPIVRGAK